MKFLLNHYSHFSFNQIRIFLNCLRFSAFNRSGRNKHGRITAYHRGFSKAARYILILDHSRIFFFLCPGLLVKTYHKKLNRFYDLVFYDNGYLAFIRAVEGLQDGDLILNSLDMPFYSPATSLSLKIVPAGLPIHNVSFLGNFKHGFSRSSGTSSRVLKVILDKNFGLINLPSGEKRFVHLNQMVTLGRLAVYPFFKFLYKKAGDKRYVGRKSVVRGVAMNPIDHPHGGGQGKTSGGRPSVSPWGIYTKGTRTSSRRLLAFRVPK